jgi:hypothetical protein
MKDRERADDHEWLDQADASKMRIESDGLECFAKTHLVR